MNGLRAAAKLFTRISSGMLLVASAYITFFWGADAEVSIRVMWQILGASAVCSLAVFIYPADEREPSKRGMLFRNILCFVYENAVVLTCAFAFEWIENYDPKMIAGMEICIIAVFAGVYLANYISDCMEAEKMNRILNKNSKNK